ncbi:MAG: hypothetical protein IJJ41_08280 [Clostridia bacterium]|nr:hypothetical protein [Clostridia bacterium]
MAKKNRNNPYYKYMPTISVRRIIHHIAAFVLTLLIFIMAASISTITGYLSNSALKKAVENQNFYKDIRQNIVQGCQSIAIPSMVNEDVFYTIFTKEQISGDIKAYIDAGIKGKNFDFDLEDLERLTKEEITQSLKDQNITVDADMQKDMQLFIEQAMEIYRKNISISYIDSFAQLRGTARPIAIVAFVVSLILTVALLFFMIAIYRFKVIHKTIRMFSYGLGGAGFMLLLIAGYCRLMNIGSGLQIIPKYLYDAMLDYIQRGLKTFIFVGILLLIFSLGLAFVSESLRSRVKKNYFARLEANFRENLNDELENKNFTPDLDMTNREEKAKKIAHDEFNRYAMDRLDSVTLNEEQEALLEKEFDLPVVSAPAHDDFTEVQVDDEEDDKS